MSKTDVSDRDWHSGTAVAARANREQRLALVALRLLVCLSASAFRRINYISMVSIVILYRNIAIVQVEVKVMVSGMQWLRFWSQT